MPTGTQQKHRQNDRRDACGPVAPVGQQVPPTRLRFAYRKALHEAAQVPPIDYRDNLQRKYRDQYTPQKKKSPKPTDPLVRQYYEPPLTFPTTDRLPALQTPTNNYVHSHYLIENKTSKASYLH